MGSKVSSIWGPLNRRTAIDLLTRMRQNAEVGDAEMNCLLGPL